MTDLPRLLDRVAPLDGMTTTAVPFLRVNRRSKASAPHRHVIQPCIGVFVTGKKRARYAGRDVEMGAGAVMVVPRATPTVSQVTEGPYLSVMLSLDLELVAKLSAFPPAASADVTGPIERLVQLLDAPSEIPALAPVFQRELFYRLLAGPSGAELRDAARGHDPAVASALAWLDARYAEPFSADQLAAHVHLSVSALYARFKARMRVTPLQYQKQRRLEAAQRLLVADGADVKSVAHRVGYSSASQFSRDYRRLFATPPSETAASMRAIDIRRNRS